MYILNILQMLILLKKYASTISKLCQSVTFFYITFALFSDIFILY